ncbi:N-6 DNA methylase [Croceibacterium sp. LX-88]|uniref:N-6 DNA methylase n=1 Tax=Croceibacterium selenioxidans TaxID=2838833 RepID=A0ABS5W719_9SPHN|nr:N-6 DNA methylase [Croceibacterium selenioxidans]MBT2134184.1 N-6 DNA methylase [Croceibacterium selenioxidans]
MSTTADVRSRLDLISELTVDLAANGRIVDFLRPETTRPDGPEERVRQYYARVLVEEYGYQRSHMAFEAPINIGHETKQADIVVYNSPEAAAARDQGQIWLIVEVKAPTITDGHRQLVSYVCSSSSSGGVWFNGEEISYFRRVEQPRLELREWTNIPRTGETWDTVGHYRKRDLRPPRELKHVFQRCHNAIYRAGLDSEDVAVDMVRIILAKYRDEQNVGELCQFRCTPDEFSSAEGQHEAAQRVRDLFAQVRSDHADVFPPTEEITIGDRNLAVVINELQPFRFLADDETEQVYDVIGTAFEVYVSAHLKGARGQFFTNRLVVNMMVEILNPSETDTIYDPACGSGGFLIAVLRYVRGRILQSDRSPAAKQREIRTVSQRLFGTDIAPRLVRVAKTNMILNGDGHGGIVRANALRDMREIEENFPLKPSAQPSLRPTRILSNPPFGASHDLRERNRDVLRGFSLGHVWEPDTQGLLQPTSELNTGEGVPPEILFLERCIDMLAPGGRLAIVIARGVLDNRDALPARQYVLTQTRLLGVVNCHPNTFAPFNGTKAAILFLEKKANPSFSRGDDYPVFMAVSQKVGQDSMGREIHRTNDNGDLVLVAGQPVLDHDLGDISRAWIDVQQGREISYEGAWTVPLSRIIDAPEMRFNPVRFAPVAERALASVLELAGSEEWAVERLGDFAQVFNGPRFKRPFADHGVTEGPSIVKMFTPKAFFEERGESVKHLDLAKATPTQLRQMEVLTLRSGYILVVDSGTAGRLLGRVGMAAGFHDGMVGNNNMIRIVIEDDARRAYVYQFLRSAIGQTLLLRNVYGTNQDHIEPDDVKDIPIPLPRAEGSLERIQGQVSRISQLREEAARLDSEANDELDRLFGRLAEEADVELMEIPVAEDEPEEAGV